MKSHLPSYDRKTTIFEGSAVSLTGKDSVRIVPLGGVGNVTKNMYVYEYCIDGKVRDSIIVDCGIGFPDAEMYGVDLIVPDVRYLNNTKHTIRGLVFSHGHDDHIGAIPYVYTKLGNIPMYGTKLTAAFANIKLREAKIKQRVQSMSFEDVLHLGPFMVSFIRVTHSIPDTSHLVIKTPIGIFYHGSDFKFDFTPLDGKISELDKITAVGREGVLCMLTDCLGSERRGFTSSETIVGDTLRKELAHSSGKLLFTTQSSNISRIQLAIDIAREYGREIAFFGRSVDQNTEESVRIGYMKFNREFVIRDRDLGRVPPSKQFLIVAGSQGQPDSALSRIANDDHKYVHLEEGDTVVFSADPIPGNENNVAALIDQIYKKGARVAYSDIMEDLHVSGHGSQGDLMLLLSTLGPDYVFPIGGTYRHIMQYLRIANELGYRKRDILVPENGQILEFVKDMPPRVVDTIELENVMVDGLGIGDVSTVVLRDRQTIATEGIVVVVIPVHASTGRVTADPDIISRGFVYLKESGELMDRARMIVNTSMKLKKGRITDWQFVRKIISENLGSFFTKEIGRYPLIVPVIIEV